MHTSGVPAQRNPVARIAIVTSGLGAGGAEQVIAQLASHWCDSGYLVDVIAFDDDTNSAFHDVRSEVNLFRLGRGTGFFGVGGRVIALRRVLARRGSDVVVSFLTKINLIAALAVLGTDRYLVCAERNNPERQAAHPLWNWLLKILYRRADAIVCQTDAVRRCFPQRVHNRLVTIPNPVPAHDVANDGTECRVVSAVGRLTYQKGFDILIEAFAEIASAHPAWRLEIWGEGEARQQLEALIREKRMEDRIELRGLSPRPRSWIANTEVFVLSSRYEGFPNVLSEAMAAGLPVVALNCDFGPADIVEDGRTGLLAAEGDVGALARAMARLMENPELRKALGREAARAMDRYRPEGIMLRWDAVLKEACCRHPCDADCV